MKMLKVTYSDQALQFLDKQTLKDRGRIISKINQYAANPSELRNQIKKLTGFPFYRLRVGNYRVIFNETGTVMKIERIGNRGDVYRGL